MRPQQPARAHCCTVRRTASSASPASKSPRATPLASCAQRSDSIVIQPAAYHARRLPPGRSAARATAARKAQSRGFRFAFAGESAGAARRASMRRVPHRHDGDGRHAPRRRQRAWQPIRRHGKEPRTGAPGAIPSTTRGIGAAATMGERGGSGAGGRTGACARGRAAPGDQRRCPAGARARWSRRRRGDPTILEYVTVRGTGVTNSRRL